MEKALLPSRALCKQFALVDRPHTDLSVAIYEIGCLFGSLFTFFLGEWFGRRRSIMLGCTVLICGAAIQTTSYGIPQLIAGRIVTGLGNGINTSTVPVWHSETTKAHNRGKALGIELAINIFGVVRPLEDLTMPS